MRVFLTLVAAVASCVAMPAMGRDFGPDDPSRYLLGEQGLLPEASASDIEKGRSARFGLREPDDDYYDAAPDEMRLRWKFNRVKMRIPFDTTALR
ncbi:MAG: hypothetical protein AB7G25_12365 [Sphingomonadaceae bacterium]